MTGFFVAIISGTLMALQGVFNTAASKQASTWTVAAFVNMTGLLVCLGAWKWTEQVNVGRIFSVRPLYLLLGGVLGAAITFTVILSMNQIGPARATLFIVIAQLLCAYIIELLGLFGTEKTPLDSRRILGMLLAIAGVVIFKWK